MQGFILSFLISTKPVLISFTAFVISLETVPSFGFGIKPFDLKLYHVFQFSPSLVECKLTLKIKFSDAIFSIKSSEPTMSAPLFLASEILSGSHKTAIFFFFQIRLEV